MQTQKDNRFFSSRRNFILAALVQPFLIGSLISGKSISETNPLSSSKEKDFIILGGWVLLNEDLIENQD